MTPVDDEMFGARPIWPDDEPVALAEPVLRAVICRCATAEPIADDVPVLNADRRCVSVWLLDADPVSERFRIRRFAEVWVLEADAELVRATRRFDVATSLLVADAVAVPRRVATVVLVP